MRLPHYLVIAHPTPTGGYLVRIPALNKQVEVATVAEVGPTAKNLIATMSEIHPDTFDLDIYEGEPK